MIKTYYMLTKPGIIFGNAVTTLAGFALASRGVYNFPLFFEALLGLCFVIASACVFNNYLDRDIDEKMERTKGRALVVGTIPEKHALIYAAILSIIGFSILLAFTNLLTAVMALIGFVVYTTLYTLMKLRTIYGTLIGSIAGAIPPVVGYTAVSDQIDIGAVILFLMVVLWQMPHFYAIAIYRLKDYQAASIPVLPVKKGMRATKVQMLLYTLAFIIASMMLTVFGYTGYSYLAVVTILGALWIGMNIQGFTCDNDTLWARKMFIFSLVVIMSLSIMIPIDSVKERTNHVEESR